MLIVAAVFVLVALCLWVLFYPAHWLVRLVGRTTPKITYFAPTRRPWVSLSLDDGPDPTITPLVLEILKREGVPATWFIIGERAERCPQMLQRIRDEGHEIGNHFWNDAPTWRMSAARLQADLGRTEHLLDQAMPKLLRPASGWIRNSQVRAVESAGYTVVLGSSYCSDWLRPPDGYIEWAMTRMCRPGSILILHVGAGRDHTPRVLPSIIRQVRARGLEFVPLRRLMGSLPASQSK